MAGMRQTETPPEAWRTLLAGYRSLTLDPSPSLRRTRLEMSRPAEEAMRSAWRSVGRAVLETVRAVSLDLRPPR